MGLIMQKTEELVHHIEYGFGSSDLQGRYEPVFEQYVDLSDEIPVISAQLGELSEDFWEAVLQEARRYASEQRYTERETEAAVSALENKKAQILQSLAIWMLRELEFEVVPELFEDIPED